MLPASATGPSERKSAERLRLSVVIVTYNSDLVMDACLRALDIAVEEARSLIIQPYNLVVVDNRSLHRPVISPSPVRDTKVLELDTNLGFAAGVNRGLGEARDSDAVLLLNPDAVLHPGALIYLVAELVRSGAALAGPLLVDSSGLPHGQSERPFHSIRREAIRQFLPFAVKDNPVGRVARRTGQARCLTGACLLASTAFLASTNGMDASIRMYLEDVELCWLAHKAGLGVRFVGDARCGHALGGSSREDNFQTSRLLYLTLLSARVEFVRRRRGQLGAAAMRALMVVGGALRAGVPILRGRHSRQMHLSVCWWAMTSGKPPAWPTI
jgi:N-acetylglucosaminyl-diphospho-decaprenol L-rhamnosyltransferase